MTNFQIITDSSCLGEASFYNENNIDIIPFHAIIDGNFYNLDDKMPLSNANIEKIILVKKDFIISKPNYLDLKTVYERHLREGRNLLILHSSSCIYDIYSSANLAVKELQQIYPDKEIILIDTETIACGIDFLIKEVLKHQELSLYEESNFIKSLNYKIASRFIINKKSMKKTLHGMLRKNYVLKENKGYIIPYSKFFFLSLAISYELKVMRKTIDPNYPNVYLVCAADEPKAKRIIKSINRHLNANIIRLEPNALLLNLTGKRAIGLFYIKR